MKSTTNLLEGGINKQLKDLARAHRGTFDEHQRIIMDWWLYVRTENPVPPLQLALEQDSVRIPLRCWQFRLKEPRIRTPSPMLGQAMFICVPSALWQRN
ncbi:transposase-like protein [Corynebacterium diphtheriae]|nr:transposase-like protein [Corynebacterium diphtheriae]